MKKILCYIFLFVILCFIVPIIFTIRVENQEEIETAQQNNVELLQDENKNKEISEASYNYKQYNTIKLLHSGTGEVQELQLDEYLIRSCISRNASKFRNGSIKSSSCCSKDLYNI